MRIFFMGGSFRDRLLYRRQQNRRRLLYPRRNEMREELQECYVMAMTHRPMTVMTLC